MKYIFWHIVVILSCLLFFSSCITNKEKLYLQAETGRKAYKSVPFEQYKMTVNDEIVYYLMTTNEETQTLFNSSATPYRIYEDGCVALPSIGRVRIAGMTVREAEMVITNRFKSIVLDAEVKVALANNFFYVQGDGGKGQFYLYKDDLNIFQAMAMAGDISSLGDKKNIKIIRKGTDGVDHIETFDLRKESIIGSEYYYVRPNDVIYIPTNPNSFFRVESVSGFVSLIVAPISLVMMAISLF